MIDIANEEGNVPETIIIQKYFRGSQCRKKLMNITDGMTYGILMECIDHYNGNLVWTEYMNTIIQVSGKKKIRNDNFPSHISENIAKFAFFKKYKIMPTWDCKGDLVMLDKQIEVKGFMSLYSSSFGPNEPWDYIYFVDAIRTREKIYKVYEIKLSNISETWRNIKFTAGKFSKMEKDGFDYETIDNLELERNDLLSSKDWKKKTITELKRICKQFGIKVGGKKSELIERILNDPMGSKYINLKEAKTYGAIAESNKRGQLRAPFYGVIKGQIDDHCQLIFDGHISSLISSKFSQQ